MSRAPRSRAKVQPDPAGASRALPLVTQAARAPAASRARTASATPRATQAALAALLREARACRLCEAYLPLGPRPVLSAHASARILVVGQAPGARVHASGIPWDDASGERLRGWMGIDRDTFYDDSRIAIVPMGLCYPGRGAGGDNPPRAECARTWQPRIVPLLPQVRLTLLIGRYAQAWYLRGRLKGSLTQTVQAFADYLPDYLPMVHPSPRNQGWFKHHPWFENTLLPVLRARVRQLL